MPEDVPGLVLNQDMPILENRPNDVIPEKDRNDITSIDKQEISNYIITLFRNDIKDKEEFGWIQKRKYDIESYYMIKNEALRHTPWEGASNSRVPLTPTLADTAHANIKASMVSSSGLIAKVKGVGPEDVRKAPILQDYMNWKLNNEIDTETPMDSNIARTVIHGTGTIKVLRNLNNVD